MTNIVGLTVFALGIVLLIWGFSESQSLAAELSQALASQRADRGTWFVAGGAAAVISGLALAIRARRA